MRVVFAAIFALITVSLVSPPAVSTVLAQESCRCKECGCKGGSGWRGPDGYCVSQAKLGEICGSPPGAVCKQEAAPRVCFGKQSAVTDPDAGRTP